MKGIVFNSADCRQMEAMGISRAQVYEQLETFRKSSFFVRLNRPCTINDGVQTIGAEKTGRYLGFHERAVCECEFLKFVPASGAATRMFQSLLQIYYMPQYLETDELNRRAAQGVAVACDFLRFIEELPNFPFLADLEEVIARDGLKLNDLLKRGELWTVLDYFLTNRGLGYGFLPKGLLKFHRYPDECRTAFEEHLVEAVHYLNPGDKSCKIHFTVSPEHEHGFRHLLQKARACYEDRFSACYDICFSYQKSSTDTIAVDLENRPFRDRNGNLHFRPGGHGALIENLNDLRGDIVFIKNVDNVTPDKLKGESVFWKKILGGYLIEMRDRVHSLLRDLKREASGETIDAAGRYAGDNLLIHFPKGYELWSLDRKYEFLFSRLNRPIRVCGVVENSGEPGGAPFWVEDRSGGVSIQIVEKAQVDMSSPEQKRIWSSSTHFNPVDLVCSVRDFEGKPFDLKRFVDGEAVFISKKSKDGRELKALELPGLWNGAMADWITMIVEVPLVTFNPVKTVYDLLRPEHQ